MFLHLLFQISNSIQVFTSIMPRPLCPCATACRSLKISRQNSADRANRPLSESVVHCRNIGRLTSVAGHERRFIFRWICSWRRETHTSIRMCFHCYSLLFVEVV